jgi:hypothetical protein
MFSPHLNSVSLILSVSLPLSLSLSLKETGATVVSSL